MTNQLWLAVLQSLITIGAVVLLWSLHRRLVDRPVFKWWAWAWTSFAIYLGVGALGLPLTAEWTLTKITLVVLVAISGFLPPLFLVFGARSVLSPDLPTRRGRHAGLALVIALSAVTVVFSLWWRDPLESFYVRIVPRTLAVAAALLGCRSSIAESDSPTSSCRTCSNRSIPPNRTAWASDSRSVRPS